MLSAKDLKLLFAADTSGLAGGNLVERGLVGGRPVPLGRRHAPRRAGTKAARPLGRRRPRRAIDDADDDEHDHGPAGVRRGHRRRQRRPGVLDRRCRRQARAVSRSGAGRFEGPRESVRRREGRAQRPLRPGSVGQAAGPLRSRPAAGRGGRAGGSRPDGGAHAGGRTGDHRLEEHAPTRSSPASRSPSSSTRFRAASPSPPTASGSRSAPTGRCGCSMRKGRRSGRNRCPPLPGR